MIAGVRLVTALLKPTLTYMQHQLRFKPEPIPLPGWQPNRHPETVHRCGALFACRIDVRFLDGDWVAIPEAVLDRVKPEPMPHISERRF